MRTEMPSGRDASLTQYRGHTSRVGSPSAGIFGIMIYSARWPAEGDPRANTFAQRVPTRLSSGYTPQNRGSQRASGPD
jgi:hypothetical protein